MNNILNRVLNFIQHRQLIVPQSDEAYRQNPHKLTTIMRIVQKLRKFKIVILQYINKLEQLDSSVRLIAKTFLILCVSVLVYLLVRKYGGNQPPGPKKPERQASKQSLKKNASFVSIKQYESHSNSDSRSQSESNYVNEKQTKIVKQYCTDIETDPHNVQYESALETKRDKFFFTLMGSFKNTKKTNNEILDENSQLDYQCEYEGESQVSPQRKPIPQAREPERVNIILE